MAEHDAHAIAHRKPPIRSVLPLQLEAEHVAVVGGAAVEIAHRQHECKRMKHRLASRSICHCEAHGSGRRPARG
jgi:hypothetical protein